MFDDFILRALFVSVAVAIATAPLGCFVVWRRMAYFGDATAHAAILGVALSLATTIPVTIGILITSATMALIIFTLKDRGYAMDTLLGVLAHSALALGLVSVSFIHSVRIDLSAYLFGDILSVSTTDVITIWAGAIIIIALMCWRWKALLTATLSDELAYATGIKPAQEQLILTLSLAIVVAISIKIVGVLLITAMLIIPAATARPLSKSPEQMAIIAALVGILSAVLGLRVSYEFDTPSGPTIVCLSVLLFVLANIFFLIKSITRKTET